VRRELERVYWELDSGASKPWTAVSKVRVLSAMLEAIKIVLFEERLDALESRMSVGVGQESRGRLTYDG
jgi:hypothetical protein